MSLRRTTELSPALMKLVQIPLGDADMLSVLHSVADVLHESVTGADGACIRLVESERADLVAGTEQFTAELEQLQDELGEGPTLSAAAQAQPVTSGSLGGEPRWSRFGPQAGRAGLHSVLALPLRAELPLGTVTFYAEAKDAFPDSAAQRARLVTAAASAVIANAQRLATANRLAASAQWAMTEGVVVERAVGILMSRRGVGADEAVMSLRGLSQRQNVRLTELAATIVDEAARRARDRNPIGN